VDAGKASAPAVESVLGWGCTSTLITDSEKVGLFKVVAGFVFVEAEDGSDTVCSFGASLSDLDASSSSSIAAISSATERDKRGSETFTFIFLFKSQNSKHKNYYKFYNFKFSLIITSCH
jgi:hypothetical protein